MDLIVAADDRTGAFETAAALADHGAGPVPVVVWPRQAHASATEALVIDLETRHVAPAEAAVRAAGLSAPGRTAHKIDSMLRGNWAHELVSRHRTAHRRVLLVPALPAFGRTCVGGVVLDHGVPVHEGRTDPRVGIAGSRPAASLRAAGAAAVEELADQEEVEGWLGAPDRSGIAVADASSDEDVHRMVASWRAHPEVVLAGASVAIGAAGGPVGDAAVAAPTAVPSVRGPVLVVCGSVHPMARSQIALLEHRGVVATAIVDDLAVAALQTDGHLALVTELPLGDVDAPLAVAAASVLARGVRHLVEHVELGAIVLIGGDTTGAVLGDTDVVVHGSVAPGTAWASVDGWAMPVITRAGGFGSDRALADLLWGTLRR